MLHVDISNIWGEISLQDLLGIEQEIFAAHNTVTEWDPGAETDRIQKAADRIRQQSRVCVVLGGDDSGTGARAVMELLQGMALTTVARIPSIVTSTLSGHAMGEEQYLASAIIYGLTGLISLIIILLYRRRMKAEEAAR